MTDKQILEQFDEKPWRITSDTTRESVTSNARTTYALSIPSLIDYIKRR